MLRVVTVLLDTCLCILDIYVYIYNHGRYGTKVHVDDLNCPKGKCHLANKWEIHEYEKIRRNDTNGNGYNKSRRDVHACIYLNRQNQKHG